MNTPNNRRRKESKSKIEHVFIELLETKELGRISVTDICKAAGVNRSTFYANYVDVFDLADAVQKNLEEDVLSLYQEEMSQGRSSYNFLKLFRHIKENPSLYRTYFKLNAGKGFRFMLYDKNSALLRFDMRHLEYHIEFFGNGLNAVIRRWLANDCRESPEEIFDIIREEYTAFM